LPKDHPVEITVRVHKTRTVGELLGRVKEQLARNLDMKFDDRRDDFLLTHANATLDLDESLESRGITSDCTMTLLHERTGDKVAAPKPANKVRIEQPVG